MVTFEEKPQARYLIAGWLRQWSDGGEISTQLPQYLIEKLHARKIGEMGPPIAEMCYPFQVAGTHDTFRPAASFRDGLPQRDLYRENHFYDAGNGLVIFVGEEPWFRIDLYGRAFFQAIAELGIEYTAAVEGYYGASPPDLERSVNCAYSRPELREQLEQYGMRFSNYGSGGRQGPTIGMALVTMAHYEYPDVNMLRVGAMAPMYPFSLPDNNQVGISQDHRGCYDIMRRLNSMFKLDLDLSELKALGEAESGELSKTLERISVASAGAREIIERVRAEYQPTPFVEPVSLDPALDRTLEDILKNIPDQREE